MIIFILVIHAGGAKDRAVCAAENVFPPFLPGASPRQSEAAFFLPEGWQVFGSETHSGEHIFWAFEHIVK